MNYDNNYPRRDNAQRYDPRNNGQQRSAYGQGAPQRSDPWQSSGPRSDPRLNSAQQNAAQRNHLPSYQQNYRRQPPKRKITGRFYAFLSCILVAGIMLGVMAHQRSLANQPVEAYQPKPVWSGDPVAPTQAPAVIVQPDTQTQTPISSDPAVVSPSAPDATQAAEDPDGWLSETETQPPVTDSIDPNSIALNARTDLPKEWRNYLLLGSDTRDMKKKSRSDTIIIASVNTTTGQVKLTSIMRDTVINIKGKDHKINDATAIGGPKLMMQLLNENMGMNITEYVQVNFASMARVIDVLGGIYLDITDKELIEINRHMGEVAAYTMSKEDYLAKREEMKLKTHGTGILVNGIQAVTFARIRYIDTDYRRTERQREVLDAILQRVKKAGAAQMAQIAIKMWGEFDTNIDMWGAIGVAKAVLGAGLDEMDEWRIPGPETSTDAKRSPLGEGFYDVNYPELTKRLHKFIYGSEFA